MPNFLDLDSDGGDRPDREECSSLPCPDSDLDCIPDFLNLDDPTEPSCEPNRLYLPIIAMSREMGRHAAA